MAYGFIKTACVSPRLKVADCCFNAQKIIEAAETAAADEEYEVVATEDSVSEKFAQAEEAAEEVKEEAEAAAEEAKE